MKFYSSEVVITAYKRHSMAVSISVLKTWNFKICCCYQNHKRYLKAPLFSSGTMLTMVLLMRALDPLVYEQETDFYLEKLVEVDGFRKGYYKDLSKYISLTIENQVLIFIVKSYFFFRGWYVLPCCGQCF